MPLDDSFHQPKTSSGHDGVFSWVEDNVLKPGGNTLCVEPYNAVSNLVSGVSLHHVEIGKLTPFEVKTAHPLTPEWFAQNISTGIAMAGIFAGAGRLMKVPVSRLGLTEESSALLNSSRTSQILGGATYEGLRDTRPGESHASNFAAGLVGFSMFEGGNYLSQGLSGTKLVGARALTGALGASTQNALGYVFAGNAPPSAGEFANSMLSGGVMNVLLPGMQRLVRFDGNGSRASHSESTHSESTSARPEMLFSKPAAQTIDVTDLTPSKPADISTITPVRPDQLPLTSTARFEHVAAGKNAGPFENWDDYLNRGRLFVAENMNYYDRQGKTTIAIPTKPSDYGRLAPETLATHLETLPAPGLVKRLIVSDYVAEEEPWLQQQTGNPNLRVLGHTTDPGTMILYRPTTETQPGGTIDHEWLHMHQLSDPTAASIFSRADGLEELHVPGQGMLTSDAESWPIFGESMLADPSKTAALVAHANPIHASIWAKSFDSLLRSIPEDQRGTRHAEYANLADFINGVVKPNAIAKLTDLAATTGESAANANQALQYLGSGH